MAFLITDGTLLSSAHACKAEGGGTFLQCGIAKKPKNYKGHVPCPGAKNAPTIIFWKHNSLKIIIIIMHIKIIYNFGNKIISKVNICIEE